MTDQPDADHVINPIADPGVPTMPREMAEQMQSVVPAFALARRLAAAMCSGVPCDAVMAEIAASGSDLVYDVLIVQTGEFICAVIDGLTKPDRPEEQARELAQKWFEHRALAQLDRDDG